MTQNGKSPMNAGKAEEFRQENLEFREEVYKALGYTPATPMATVIARLNRLTYHEFWGYYPEEAPVVD